MKSYHAAQFAHRLNLLNSLPALLNKFVPVSLLDRLSLEEVLTIVQNIQIKARDRVTLAIPFQETLSYYETQLLQDIVALSEGLLITMSIPLASRQTILTTYEAMPLPVPQHEDDMALISDTYASFLVVSEDSELRESASNGTAHLSTRTYPGCRICIYTLPCDHHFRGPNIFIQSDLQSCSRVPSLKIHGIFLILFRMC